jgi:hypothetical protein
MLEHLKKRIKQVEDAAKPLPEEDRNVRYDICNSCEHFFAPTSQCKKCGCFMQAKTYLPFTECPVGKWGKFIRESEDKN